MVITFIDAISEKPVFHIGGPDFYMNPMPNDIVVDMEGHQFVVMRRAWSCNRADVPTGQVVRIGAEKVITVDLQCTVAPVEQAFSYMQQLGMIPPTAVGGGGPSARS